MSEPGSSYVDVSAALRNIAAWNDDVRAVITSLDESALTQAAECDQAAGVRGTLHGWPIAIKDNIDTAGATTTSGSKFFENRHPDADAFVVERLREAGAVFTAKCNLAEFALGATTDNAHYGQCRNAWDRDRIPGGSSGGSAVAVALDMARASLGTDTGGSVRIPAAVNGLVGLRPTLGRISNRGVTPISGAFDTVGPIAHTAREAATVFDVIDEFDWTDPTSRPGPRESALSDLDRPVDGLRVGVPEEFFFDDLDAGVEQRVREFLDTLGKLGAEVCPVSLPDADLAQGHMFHIVYPDAANFHAERIAHEPETFGPEVLARLRLGDGVDARKMSAAYDWRAIWQRRVECALRDVDVIVTPTLPVDVPLINPGSMIDTTHRITTFSYAWAMYSGPSIAIPAGFHPESGMPVSGHVTASPWADALLFRIANAVEQITDFHLARPPLLGSSTELTH